MTKAQWLTADGRDLAPAQRLLAWVLRARWTRESLPQVLLDAVQPDAFLHAVQFHGVAGILLTRHTTQLRSLPLSFTGGVMLLHHRHAARAQHQFEVLREIVTALAAAGIDSLPLKGLALSWQLYADMTVRHSGDLDILVDPAAAQAAAEVLVALGCEPAPALPARALHWRARMRDSHHTNFHHPTGLYVELHWRTDPLRITSLPPLSSLASRLERFESGPLQGLHRLPPDLLMRSQASHACRSRGTRWKWSYDLLEMLSAGADAAPPWAPERRREPNGYVRQAVTTIAAQWEVPVRRGPAVAMAVRAGAVERHLWLAGKDRHRRPLRDGLVLHCATWLAQTGWRARLEYWVWVGTRISPDVGDRAYSLVARMPWLAPMVRLAAAVRGRLRRVWIGGNALLKPR